MLISAAVTRDAGAPPVIEEIELDAPRGDEVLVKLVATGVCHTDLFAPQLVPLPAVFGHEGAGIVERVGERVTKLRPGDRVAMTFGSCGQCRNCLDAAPSCCEVGNQLQMGGRRADGTTTLSRGAERIHGSFFQQSSFASHALGIERSVVKLPDAMPLELAGPLGCGIQTGAGAILRTLQAPAGSSLAVFGAGAVGLAAIMAAHYANLGTIVAVDIDPARLELARELGATHAIDAREGDVGARLRAIEPRGLMYSLETSAAITSLVTAIECLMRRGVCAIVTVPSMGKPVPFSLLPLLKGGHRLVAVLEGDSVPDLFIPQLAQMYLAGQLPIDRLVRDYAFTDIESALADAQAGRTIKPILRF